MSSEIQSIVNRISDDLQELELLLYVSDTEKININFPRGVIRTAGTFRSKLDFIDNQILRTNIAYHLMLSDVYRWILNRFDISLTAKEMLIKEGISLIGNITEAILKYVAIDILGNDPKIGFSRACSVLMENRIISKEQKKELKWLWNMRCKEHIYNLRNTEYGKYTIEHYNIAIKILKDFELSIKKAREERLI